MSEKRVRIQENIKRTVLTRSFKTRDDRGKKALIVAFVWHRTLRRIYTRYVIVYKTFLNKIRILCRNVSRTVWTIGIRSVSEQLFHENREISHNSIMSADETRSPSCGVMAKQKLFVIVRIQYNSYCTNQIRTSTNRELTAALALNENAVSVDMSHRR